MGTAVILAAAILQGCSRPGSGAEEPTDYLPQTLVMGTGEENGTVWKAGFATAEVINNTVPGIHVAVEASKGSPVNAVNVADGTWDLAIIPGDTAYDAISGENGFRGEKIENLCVLAACYQEVSGWAALEESGLSMVHELRGKIISSGPAASRTEMASKAVFRVLGIDESNTEIYSDGLSDSVGHVMKQTADAVHGFAAVPLEAHERLAAESGAVFLSYTEEELEQILKEEPGYFKTVIPAGTYSGQEEEVLTFGVKVLLCAGNDMDPDLAYEIARAMDLNGPVYTGNLPFMSMVQDKKFLCNDLPIPLHEGAERYYREMGYLTN